MLLEMISKESKALKVFILLTQELLLLFFLLEIHSKELISQSI